MFTMFLVKAALIFCAVFFACKTLYDVAGRISKNAKLEAMKDEVIANLRNRKEG